MKIEIWLLGKSESYINQQLENYSNRLKRYIPIEIKVFIEKKNQQKKTSSSNSTLNKLDAKDYLIILDEKGKQFSSLELSKRINQFMLGGSKNIVFLVGGAYGFSDDIYERANESWSLSKMTFSHQLARLIFMEQLYRAFTIIHNEPYHHA